MSRALLILRCLEKKRVISLKRRRRTIREGSVPLDLPEKEFIKFFRLSKKCFEDLSIELSPFLASGTTKARIDKKLRVLAALSFFANGSYQQGISTRYSLGMAQTSVSQALRQVVDALNEPSVLRRHIVLPGSQDRERIKKGFMDKFGMPDVIGCIDGTHVALLRPTKNEELFLNRKQYHSRNVQIVCDDNLNIINVDASFGGAMEDSSIFNQCSLKKYLERLSQQGESVSLLGDLGYPQKPYLMTPIPNAVEGSPEAHYNSIHMQARNTVERCIGVLKNRWRCLMAHKRLHYDHLTVEKMVNACCVLHNIANRNNLPEPVVKEEQKSKDLARQIEIHSDDQSNDAMRRALVARLWSSR